MLSRLYPSALCLVAISSLSACESRFFVSSPEVASAAAPVELKLSARYTTETDAEQSAELCLLLPAGWLAPEVSFTRTTAGSSTQPASPAGSASVEELTAAYPVDASLLKWHCFTSGRQLATNIEVEEGNVTIRITAPPGTEGVVPIKVLHKDSPPVTHELRFGVTPSDTFEAWRSAGWVLVAQNPDGIVHGGDRFLALGVESLTYSLDGVTWESKRLPNRLTHAAFGHSTWVAVAGGRLGTLDFEADIESRFTVVTEDTDIQSIVFANGLFVAAGKEPPRLLTSPDGSRWAEATLPPLAGAITAVGSNDDGFVAFADESILRSSDGVVWSGASVGLRDVQRVVHGNGRWVAFASPADRPSLTRLVTSTDDWSSWQLVEGLDDGEVFLRSLNFTDARFIVSHDRIAGAKIVKGISTGLGGSGWVSLDTSYSGEFTAIAQSPTRVVLLGDWGFVATSEKRPAGAPVLAKKALPRAHVNAPYGVSLDVRHGEPPVTLAITDGALPQGLTLQDGLISGSASAPGTSTFTVVATDARNRTSTAAFMLEAVSAPSLPVERHLGFLANGSRTVTLPITGGEPPFTLGFASTVDMDGTVDGSSVKLTLFRSDYFTGADISVQVSDANGAGDTKRYFIGPAKPLEVTGAAPAPLVTGRAWAQRFIATSAAPPFFWTIDGALPEGVETVGGRGEVLLLTGKTSSGEGSFPITLGVEDAAGQTATFNTTLEVWLPPALVETSLPPAIKDEPYETRLTLAHGAPLVQWEQGEDLPPGLSLREDDGDFVLEGTPEQEGEYVLSIILTDARDITTVAELELAVLERPTPLAPQMTTGSTGSFYALAFMVDGGRMPYSFALTGSLPQGLSFTSDANSGLISGMPTEAGEFPVKVTVTSADGLSADFEDVTVTILPTPYFASEPPLPDAELEKPYTGTIQVLSGLAPYVWEHDGALPPGLAFEPDGDRYVLSGTPHTAGTFVFSVRASDANALEASRDFTVTVRAKAAPDKDPSDKGGESKDPEDGEPSGEESGGCGCSGGGATSLLALFGLVLTRRGRRASDA